MNPVYLVNPPPSSPFHPLIEPTEDQHLQLFNPSSEASYSSLSNSIFSNPAQVQGGSYDREQQEQQHHQQQQQQQQQQQHKAIKCSVLQVSSSYHHEFLESPPLPTVENGLNNGLQASVCERDDRDVYQSNGGVRSIKWMSSKMRLMRKMTKNSTGAADKQLRSRHKFKDHQQPPMSSLDTDDSSNTSTNKSNTNNSTVRICSDCNTTKTPLWRSGPRGPKSLCNACGIRQRKARCAMAAAAAASGELLGNDISAIRTNVPKEKRSDNGYVQQYKKRCKLTGPRTRKKLCVEDFTINLSKNSAFHRVFPQDEKEAAILLMALSCGLVRG